MRGYDDMIRMIFGRVRNEYFAPIISGLDLKYVVDVDKQFAIGNFYEFAHDKKFIKFDWAKLTKLLVSASVFYSACKKFIEFDDFSLAGFLLILLLTLASCKMLGIKILENKMY